MSKLSLKVLLGVFALCICVGATATELTRSPKPKAKPDYEALKIDRQRKSTFAREKELVSAAQEKERRLIDGSIAETFGKALSTYWLVDEGKKTYPVTVAIEFYKDGKVKKLELVSGSGPEKGIRYSYAMAKRAIYTCLKDGALNLPESHYDRWQKVIITFDPNPMRSK